MHSPESARLENLRTYCILDTAAEREFDELAEMAALLCDVPMAAVSFVDENRVWLKSRVGFVSQNFPRVSSFCEHVVKLGDEVIITDATADATVANLPLVQNLPYIKFYAGFPLVSQEGFVLGTLCIMDLIPRTLTSTQKKCLLTLANQLCALLEKNRFGILLEHEKRKTVEMAASIVHEINNPLTVLQARASMLTPENAVENGKKMLEAAKRMVKIIDGLSLTYGESASSSLESVFLKDVIDETLSFCQLKFANSDVQLEYQSPSPDLKIKCRSVQLSQVILNLLNNAHDAASEVQTKKRWVRLEIEEHEELVIISVINSGNLIPSEHAEKIFTPFFTTKVPGKGTGLGLSIAREIMAAHHGTLKLSSTARNTTFSLSLPK